MVDVVVKPAAIAEHHHVVDAGCGVGGTAVHLANAHGCRVTGVNVNRLQLEIAEKKVVDAGVADRVGLEYADCCQSLPFADNTIDVVVNIESACHYSDRERFLHEVQRILKPGGTIVAMDWMARNHLSTEQYEKFIRPICEAWAMVSLECQATYTGKLQEAGLEIMEFEGFGGREMDNLKIIENDYRNLTLMYFNGFRTPPFLNLMDSIGRLYAAWRDGYFEIRRYCAKK